MCETITNYTVRKGPVKAFKLVNYEGVNYFTPFFQFSPAYSPTDLNDAAGKKQKGHPNLGRISLFRTAEDAKTCGLQYIYSSWDIWEVEAFNVLAATTDAVAGVTKAYLCESFRRVKTIHRHRDSSQRKQR
jgi:hypothetical protein